MPDCHAGHPSAWINRWLAPVSRSQRALDLACGSGRHARLASERGYRVLAVDRNPDGQERLADCKDLEFRTEDLEGGRWSFSAERFAVVMVTNYLFRPKLDDLPTLLDPGGRLLYETFGQGQAAYGKPSNPDFLLAAGELLALASRHQLTVLAFEDGVEAVAPGGWRRVQRIVAVRPPFEPTALALNPAPLPPRPAAGLS